ncbi:aldehyde dehydrogenase family protein [Flaviaesturariibacter aridisoli]|uniref:Aldehyde dehydrogenase n=1 Tax=Flaviaesturariibacter aridisoli TaxID=2545761 RepID=A0A4R4DT98_9BACT|nr:aldehyde dehydrogenase family protein [Flaviaesturariibacter aridisoli]
MLSSLEAMRRHTEEGGLRSYEARVDALKRLKAAVLQHEGAINDALMADLGKSIEETWVTETGFLLTELTHALKHLKSWMRPEKVHTNLLNLPSKSRIYKEPLGVVCIIGPWNYPLQLLLAPLVGALAAGNAALLKPSEWAPATAAVVRRIVEGAFRAEEVAVLEGDGATVIPPLLRAFRFDHIFYTGSTHVGQKIYALAAEKLVPVTLELGGKSPCVIEPDADLKVAARRIAMTKFSNAGQMCVAPDYVLVHASVRDAFVQQLMATIRQFFTDDPARSGHYGKIVNERAFHRLQQYLAEGTVLFGGKSDAATLYIEPTLIGDLPPDAAIMGEEIFGPLLPILTWTRFEEARALIRRHADPLAFYVFTQSKEAERRWIEGLPFGGGCVNNASWHLTNPALPFGGRGKSGIGAYHGRASFDTFSHRKSVLKTPTWFDPSLKYPPFKGKLSLFKKVIR